MFKGGITNGVQSCENRRQEMNIMGTEHNGYREYMRVEQEVNINRKTKKKRGAITGQKAQLERIPLGRRKSPSFSENKEELYLRTLGGYHESKYIYQAGIVGR